MKKEFLVEHCGGLYEFKLIIDLDARGVLHESMYERFLTGNSVKSEIFDMSMFFHGHPPANAPFEDHLIRFVEIVSNEIAYFISDNYVYDEQYICRHLNEQEGFYPIFGNSVKVVLNDVNKTDPTDYTIVELK